MVTPKAATMSPEELERLMAELDTGALDEQLPPSAEAKPAPLAKFVELSPFDVRAWAQRRGIKLPEPKSASNSSRKSDD